MQAPEMGLSRGYHLGPQRQSWTTTAAIATTKDPACKHRSLPTSSRVPMQHTTAAVPWFRANFPRRTHDVPQAVATTHQPLPPQAFPTSQLWLLYPSLPLTWVSKRALISHCFNPFLSGWGTDPWRRPTCRGGAKSTAEAQELCKERREREISPCSLRSSGLSSRNQLGKPCICGIPE